MFKFLNIHQILSSILSIILVILIPIFPQVNFNQIFWTVLFWNMWSNYKFLDKWAKDGITWFRRNDKDYNKNITRHHSDFIFFLVGIVSFLILSSLSMSIFNISFAYNYIWIIIIETLTIIQVLLLAYSTSRVNKQIVEIIKNKK